MMRTKLGTAALVALPLVAGGWVYASTLVKPEAKQTQQSTVQNYTCPLTGEELPCRNCCPLGQQK